MKLYRFVILELDLRQLNLEMRFWSLPVQWSEGNHCDTGVYGVHCVLICVCVWHTIDEEIKGTPCDLGFNKEKLMRSPVCLSFFLSSLSILNSIFSPSYLSIISLSPRLHQSLCCPFYSLSVYCLPMCQNNSGRSIWLMLITDVLYRPQCWCVCVHVCMLVHLPFPISELDSFEVQRSSGKKIEILVLNVQSFLKSNYCCSGTITDANDFMGNWSDAVKVSHVSPSNTLCCWCQTLLQCVGV